MSLITRCPKCSSAFRVVADQLRLHDGFVRCGACSHVFDGFACLDSDLPTLTNKVTEPQPDTPTVETFLSVPQDTDEQGAQRGVPRTAWSAAYATPTASSAPTASNTPLSRASAAAPVVMRGRSPVVSSDRPESPSDQDDSSDAWLRTTPEPSLDIHPRLADEPVLSGRKTIDGRPEPTLFREPEPEPDSVSPIPGEPVLGEARLRDPQIAAPGSTPPPFMDREQEPGMFSAIAWGVACLLAFLLLCLQVLYVFRNEIGTAVPSMRSQLNLMCARLGCEVSYVRQLERITFTASSLQQTDVAGADGTPPRYLLKFSMRNRYDKPQPWPSLLLSLTDAGGTVVVRKMVLPHEYLPRTLIDQPFAAGQELNLELPLVVRGAQVQGFQLEKFFP